MNREPLNPDISNITESEEYRRHVEAQEAIENGKLTRGQRFMAFFKNGRTRFAMGVILLFLGFYLLISFVSFFSGAGATDQNYVDTQTVIENAKYPERTQNAGAVVGAKVSDLLIADGVGVAAFILVIWCCTIGWRMVRKGRKTHFFSYTLVSLFSIFTVSMVVGACTYGMNLTFFPLGGGFGYFANKWLHGLVGIYGMIAVNIIVVMLWVMLCYNTIKALVEQARKRMPTRRNFKGDELDTEKSKRDVDLADLMGNVRHHGAREDHQEEADVQQQAATERPRQQRQSRLPRVAAPVVLTDEPARIRAIEKGVLSNPHDPTGEYIHYKFPTLDLLQDIKMRNSVDKEEQEANKQRITETLGKYGIEIKQIEVHVGPTVTLFEIIPQDGVRISRIRGLEDDIALSLAALGIRIIAPMPGRGTIGIEVPNRDPQVVPMRQVIESKAFQESKAELPMCLGCTVSNEVFVADLTKMPHLLVAGATGKGKSVGLNAIITSLLYKKGPSELKLVLIDPKRVEFSVYADIEKYYFAKVDREERAIVTDTQKVVRTLNSLVQEMEDRYSILEEVKERNIKDYNKKWKTELREIRDEHGEKKYHFMPYIVAVVDEFSDMIMTAGKEVEGPIVRIAQKARAVGIHMIIATQRPSANVITGLIKGNFPGRIAFAVSQMMDSRIIIDRSGAQQLIGRGDMLFSIDGDITRLQCPFVDTPDIERICNFIKEQEDNDKNIDHDVLILPEYVAPTDASGGGTTGTANLKERDPLFEEAVKWIVQGDVASTSSLQRRYEIGYNRAGRIMDQMQQAGIVGPSVGGKPRKVLLTPLEVDQLFS
ncbi:MAG: DNA translocase FtsK 4TM domain-containing protein [Muribaculaceae bacterium]|nr:DNA translocase FtsK 4TM domain-containing protein [Muribaculaceae bacterium]